MNHEKFEMEANISDVIIKLPLSMPIPQETMKIILDRVLYRSDVVISEEERGLIEEVLVHDKLSMIEENKRLEFKRVLYKAKLIIEYDAGPELKFDGTFGLPKEFGPFTGREDELKQLMQAVGQIRVIGEDPGQYSKSTQKLQTHQLTGTGGVGKSTLANYFVRESLKTGYFQWAVWIRAGVIDSRTAYDICLNKFIELGASLGININVNQGQKLVHLVYQELSQRGRGIVVFDDAQEYKHIQDLLPSTFNYHDMDVLVTTRNSLTWGPSIVKISVGIFSQEDAIKYIEKVLLPHKKYGQEEANALAKVLGCFPLALTQALRYIVNNPITIAGYIALFQKTKASQLNYAPFEDDDHQLTILATVKMSLEKIGNPEAHNVLHTCGYLAPEAPIAVELCGNWTETLENRNQAIVDLKQYSLLKESHVINHVEIHQMVQTIVTLNDDQETREVWLDQVMNFMRDYYESEQQSLIDEKRKKGCLPHLVQIIDHVGEGYAGSQELKIQQAQMRGYLGSIYMMNGQSKIATMEYQQGIAVFTEFCEENDPRIASFRMNFGTAVLASGDPQVAYSNLMAAFPVLSKKFGNEHPIVGLCMMNLGAAISQLGGSFYAVEYLEKALTVLQKKHGSAHPIVAKCNMNLGIVMLVLEYHKRGIEYLEQALLIFRQEYGEEHPSVAGCTINLGLAYLKIEDAERARGYLETARQLLRNEWGDANPEVAKCTMNLGIAILHLGDGRLAKEHLETALPVLQKYEAVNSLATVCKLSLCLALLQLGKLRSAKQYFKAEFTRFVPNQQTEGLAHQMELMFSLHFGQNNQLTKRFIDLIQHAYFNDIKPPSLVEMNRLRFFQPNNQNTGEPLFHALLSNKTPINGSTALLLAQRCEALNFPECALDLVKFTQEETELLEERYLLEARCFMAINNFEEAQSAIFRYMELSEDDMTSQNILAELEKRKREFEILIKSIDHFKSLIASKIEDHILCAKKLRESRNYIEAIDLLKKSSHMNGNNLHLGAIYFQISRCYLEMREYGLAREAIITSLHYQNVVQAVHFQSRIESEQPIYEQIRAVSDKFEKIMGNVGYENKGTKRHKSE